MSDEWTGAGTGRSGEADSDATATIEVAVPSMDCPSCARKVERSAGNLPGLQSVEPDVMAGVVRVTYDPDRTSVADVVRAIERAGYEVLDPPEAGDDGDRGGGDREGVGDGHDGDHGHQHAMAPATDVWRSPRAIKTWIGAVFLAVGLLLSFLLIGSDVVVATVLGAPLTLADALLLAATVAAGVPVVRNGYYSARNLSLDIDLLMGAAIVAATGIGLFVEAATLAVLFSVAELLEEYSMDRARASLRELMELSPDEATVRRDGEEVTVPVEDVAVDEVVTVRPGEKIPLDGEVVGGTSAVDESPITGESVPVDKREGDAVYAGSINDSGYLEVRVTSTAGDSTLSRIIEMVRGAQREKTETEQFVDHFADYYTPVVVAFAIVTAAVPPLAFGAPWRLWFVRGLTLLVIACPCAFVISTPVSVVSGITSGARNGVLVKGGTHLEAMGEVGAVAFDKTGTLTKAALAVTDVVPLGEHDEVAVLRYARALERRSEHPIADALVAAADERGIDDVPEVRAFENLPGEGVRAEIAGETYYAGTPALFERLGVDLTHAHVATDGGVSAGVPDDQCERPGCVDLQAATLADLEDEGKTVVLVGTDERLLGVVAVADEVRPGAARAVERLHELGVEHVVMLTGDNEGTARAIAESVGIGEYRADLLPDEKVAAIEALEAEYGDVAMVGDGVNDAPALAAATVGIAMGAAGTDTALETADVALMGDDLAKVPYLYALSRRANGVIRENVWSSLGVKALLALGVPFGYVTVAVAVVVGDMGMSLAVTGNAMRLARLKPERLQ